MRSLAAEIDRRRATDSDRPRDLLDVVAAQRTTSDDRSADLAKLAEVYLAFVFTLAGAIGFALAWSIYLVGTHPETVDCPPQWIVREALRLWPVAWLFGRTPARSIEISGHVVGPRQEVNVCAYLVHRHPGSWIEPNRFWPQRWADSHHDGAYLPFGHGEHSCPGSQPALSLLADLVAVILRDGLPSVTPLADRGPQVSAALAPAPFTLRLGRSGGAASRTRSSTPIACDSRKEVHHHDQTDPLSSDLTELPP